MLTVYYYGHYFVIGQTLSSKVTYDKQRYMSFMGPVAGMGLELRTFTEGLTDKK